MRLGAGKGGPKISLGVSERYRAATPPASRSDEAGGGQKTGADGESTRRPDRARRGPPRGPAARGRGRAAGRRRAAARPAPAHAGDGTGPPPLGPAPAVSGTRVPGPRTAAP